jgi:Flp pilus assembly protein TadG
MSKKAPPQRGAVLILFAVLLPILLGFAALAVDVAFVVMTKARMQNAADAAALAGASGLLAGETTASARLTALNLANLNGYTADAFTVVTISNPPGANPNGTTPTFAADATYVRATIVQTVGTYFAKTWGFSTIALTATAVAAPGNLALPGKKINLYQ